MAASFIADNRRNEHAVGAPHDSAEFSSVPQAEVSETRQLIARFRAPVAPCFTHYRVRTLRGPA